MALDVTRAGAVRRLNDLQARLWNARHESIQPHRKVSAKQLFQKIRRYLLKASDQRLLDDSHETIHQKLKFVTRADGTYAIAVGDVRNFRRDQSLPHFRRRDRAWFDFQLQLEEQGRGIEVLAYDFELRLAPDAPDAHTFVRFDLNPAGHDNDEHGLRSHMHVNSDDDGMSVPAPVMSPFELLDVMVHGLVRTGRQRRTDLTTEESG